MGNLVVVLPLVPGVGAVLVYGVARLVTRRNGVLAMTTASILACGLGLTAWIARQTLLLGPLGWRSDEAAHNVLLAEPASLWFALVALGLGMAVSLYSGRYLSLDHRYEHYYPLLLLMLAGVVGMVMAVDLFTLYLFTVMTSAASYVLVAFRRRTETAIEAGFKYVIMGSMASVLVLAGIGLVFREAGELALPLDAPLQTLLGRVGLGLLVGAYLIKAAVFPGHTWLPDAHGRAPSSISAILSGIIIQAYLYALLKVALGVGAPKSLLGPLLIVLSCLSMTVANLMGLRQDYGKRLLGYSSVAQTAYMLLGFGLGLLGGSAAPLTAALFLLLAHALLKSVAFLCKGALHFYCQATLLRDLDGMGQRMPLVSTCMIIALSGLAGIPPLAGFVGKLALVRGALVTGSLWSRVGLAVFLINALLSLGYYLPLIGRILKPLPEVEPVRASLWMRTPIVLLTACAVLLGLVPGPALAMAERAARFVLEWGPR